MPSTSMSPLAALRAILPPLAVAELEKRRERVVILLAALNVILPPLPFKEPELMPLWVGILIEPPLVRSIFPAFPLPPLDTMLSVVMLPSASSLILPPVLLAKELRMLV